MRWVRVLPVLALVAFTAYSVGTQPSAPAARPAPPSTLIDTSHPVLDCMLSTACSGLFGDGVVEKSPVLRRATENALGERYLTYWIHPGVPPHLKRTIRNRIMPTLADWTHSNPVETIDASSWKVLRWFSDVGQDGAPSCVTSDIAWSGCADSSGNGNAATVKAYLRGIQIPPDILYGVGLHEAMHALYGADHSTRGLMCHREECYVELREGRRTWSKARHLTRTDHEVYTLYGHPAIREGMTREEVSLMVRTP